MSSVFRAAVVEPSDPALDENDVVVALTVNVFGGIDPLLDDCCPASLEEHRLGLPADLPEKSVV